MHGWTAGVAMDVVVGRVPGVFPVPTCRQILAVSVRWQIVRRLQQHGQPMAIFGWQ